MRKLTIALFFTFVFFACERANKKVAMENEKKVEKITVPSFNRDSAYQFIKKQVGFGPRVPGTRPHYACGDYLVEKFKSYGAQVHEQEFTDKLYYGETVELRNIIASINPGAKKRILLAAHWDTRKIADKDEVDPTKPLDGANDGASGVGILLELARTISKNGKLNVGVDFILFDGEDNGEPDSVYDDTFENGKRKIWWCLGSQYWSQNLHINNYSAYYGILLDMVGAKDATFYMEGGSVQFAPKIVGKIWDTAHDLGYGGTFVKGNSPGITDDHIFVNQFAKIPMIDIIDYDPDLGSSYFPEYHHTHMDNMDIIDKQTLQAVGETLLFVLYHE